MRSHGWVLFLAAAFCLAATAAQPVEASSATPVEAHRKLLDLEDIKEKAKEHAEAIRKNAPGAIAGAQDAAGKAWGFTTSVSQQAAEQATGALEKSMEKSMQKVINALKVDPKGEFGQNVLHKVTTKLKLVKALINFSIKLQKVDKNCPKVVDLLTQKKHLKVESKSSTKGMGPTSGCPSTVAKEGTQPRRPDLLNFSAETTLRHQDRTIVYSFENISRGSCGSTGGRKALHTQNYYQNTPCLNFDLLNFH